MNKNAAIAVTEKMRAIAGLNLESIKAKLMDSEDGPGWTREQADRCETEYRRFLVIAAAFRRAAIVPSVEVDHFWHAHILDTRKYAEDCRSILGFFLHHAPHSGAKKAKDRAKLEKEFADTRRLYEQIFGASAAGRMAWCGRAADGAGKRAAWCGIASDKADKRAAWCGIASDEAGKSAAWCGIASDEADKRATWCGRASDALPTSARDASSEERKETPVLH